MASLDQERGAMFCRRLLSTLRSCLFQIRQSHVDVLKEKSLKQFHVVHLTELNPLWTALCVDMSLNSVCPLLLQSVNRRIFEQVLIEHFSETTSTSLSSAEKAEEENALRYVGGYVALKLLHKYV